MVRVLGIDPGTHRVGWGIIEGTPSKHKIVAFGCIESKPGTQFLDYLPTINSSLTKIMGDFAPDILGIETLLFQKNVSTAITVAQARGVILLSATQNRLPIIELAPNTVKSAVTGAGNAGKKDVERMVGLLLHIDTNKILDDTTDALAIAIAALVTHRL